MNLRAVKIGWLFLTVGLISGAIWASDSGLWRSLNRCRWPTRRFSSRCSAGRSIRSSCTRSAIGGWRGRRAAWLSAVGFGIVLLNFVPVSYFFTKSHNF